MNLFALKYLKEELNMQVEETNERMRKWGGQDFVIEKSQADRLISAENGVS